MGRHKFEFVKKRKDSTILQVFDGNKKQGMLEIRTGSLNWTDADGVKRTIEWNQFARFMRKEGRTKFYVRSKRYVRTKNRHPRTG